MAKLGKQSISFESEPRIVATSTIVGPIEGKGPLRDSFHHVLQNDTFGEKTFERAERKMLKYVIGDSIQRAGIAESDVEMLLGGDLLNQIISASFTAREFDTAFVGLYGACSTMAESLAVGAAFVDGGYMNTVACTTGTHFSTAERQYRFPLEQGAQRPPSSQWTVTGAACSILQNKGTAPRVTGATFGKVIDYGVSDMNNMGAAMAPAAMSTLCAHFQDFHRTADDYDLILTGDLGVLGSKILCKLMEEKGYSLKDKHSDCGMLIYRVDASEFQGGSGCGCSAVVFNSYIYDKLVAKDYKRILFMATGALLSPLSSQQGETIPGVAHAVVVEA